LNLLSRPRRPHRSHEWDAGRAVTFIVTLAARRSVTLAATAAGMSRKSAYALKDRDPLFAAAWNAALKAREGDKAHKADTPPPATPEGDIRTPMGPSVSAANPTDEARRFAELQRDLFFARLRQQGAKPGGPRQVSL